MGIKTLSLDPRITVRKPGAPNPEGECVVYWMQRAQWDLDNPALDVAVEMAAAAWPVWRQRNHEDVWLGLALFMAQLIPNRLWSLVFFGRRRPGAALVEIIVLLAAIAMTAMRFAELSHLTFWLMTPYGTWVLYASYLNFGIWRLNKGTA